MLKLSSQTERNSQTKNADEIPVSVKVDAWQPMGAPFFEALGKARLETLRKSEKSFDADNRKIVFLTFENRFAPLGGLAAVMRFLPEIMKKYGEDVILLTPLYTNIPRVKEALENSALKPVFKNEIFDLSPAAILNTQSADKKSSRGAKNEKKISCYKNSDSPVCAYYIGIEGNFTAEQNPYSYIDDEDILSDSLMFCAAVPHVLKRLGITENILFHAHDWETAPISVTSKLATLANVIKSSRTVLTLHNSFDSGMSAAQKNRFFGKNTRGETVLQCSIPLLNGPLTTVSAPFAKELCLDALQRTVFTNHLQKVFAANPPIGIENGMFGRPHLQYTYSALSRARQGEFSRLLKQKSQFREKMFDIVKKTIRKEVIGTLNLNKCEDKPIVFMSGRLDLMQKGFDVIFRAMQKMPKGKIGLIFCPSSAEGAKAAKELAMFASIAKEHEGDIVIWPFRISAQDYSSVVMGSSFLLMPSFYEPFGAATEGFINGTPVIARATGGLLVQVRSNGNEFDSGILYREEERATASKEWKKILDAPVPKRVEVPLYQSMADAALKALLKAADVFANKGAYARMMLNGIDSLRNFSWDIAARKYRMIYEAAARRGYIDK